jgi:2-(3-amino-3-carboxypropyl)histidine synthase
MKTIFIHAKYKEKIILPKLKIREKGKIGIITTIQFLSQIKNIQQQLRKQKIQSVIGGQILGCNIKAVKAIQNKVQAFLYIGSGKFHPITIAQSLKKENQNKLIYIYNPLTKEFSKLKQEEINKTKAKKRTAKIKFLSADIFGILVSIKPGQNKIKEALVLKKKLEKKGKKVYILVFDNFDINQLENFPKVECWINTACPGLSLEQPFIWIDDIEF